MKIGLERNPQQTKHNDNENQQKVKLKHIYEGRETTFVEQHIIAPCSVQGTAFHFIIIHTQKNNVFLWVPLGCNGNLLKTLLKTS